MTTLYLNRQFRLEGTAPAARVVCEPRAGVSRGWCARVRIHPVEPYGLWDRDYLAGAPGERDGRPVNVFRDLAPGYYEAHSAFRSRKSQSVYFRVTRAGAIVVLGTNGDEDLVVARLNRMTPDELYDARAAAEGADGLPALAGSVKQVRYARDLRDKMLARFHGDPETARRILAVTDATWFIAHRGRSREELRALVSDPPAPGRGGPAGSTGPGRPPPAAADPAGANRAEG